MEILIALGVLALIALICAIVLTLAASFFAVKENEKVVAVRDCLPGANCGACGYSGCDGYAAALSKGETTNTALCSPGGSDVSGQIAEITGLAAGDVAQKAAIVLCQGSCGNCDTKLEYEGVHSCSMAQQLFGGPKKCQYGCIGFGDCISVCPYNAIKICDGVARIDPTLCRACGMCIKACPKHLIDFMPTHQKKATVLCKNGDKGAMTRKNCKTGCIGCMKCAKTCEFGAVTVTGNKAVVDYDKCTGCGKCTDVCPVKCITLINLGGSEHECE